MKLVSRQWVGPGVVAAGVAIAVLVAGVPVAPAADDVLATVGGEPITRGYLAEVGRLRGSATGGQAPQALLGHLADRKMLAMATFADADAAERERVAAGLRLDEEKRLGALYRAAEVEGKVAPVTAAEVEASSPRLKLYDLTQYTFKNPERAGEFLARHRAAPEAFSMHYTTLRYQGLTLAERYLVDQAAGLRGLKAGDYSEPLRWGREFTAVFRADAVRDEDAAALEQRRGTVLQKMAQRRLQSRFNEVLTALLSRYAYRETDVLGRIRDGGVRVAALDDDVVIATRDGGTYTGADLKRELEGYNTRSPHGAMAAGTVVKVFHEAVERDLFAAAARAEGLDRSPELAAYRALSFDLAWSNAFADRVRRDADALRPEEVRAFYDAQREKFPESFESEQAAVRRALTKERVAKLIAERIEAARTRFPIVIVAP